MGKKTKQVKQVTSARSERLARAALQATRALEASLERDSRWVQWMHNGTVLAFDHELGEQHTKYRFAAMRVAGHWYVTGTIRRRLTDDELIEFIGDEDVVVATSWERI